MLCLSLSRVLLPRRKTLALGVLRQVDLVWVVLQVVAFQLHHLAHKLGFLVLFVVWVVQLLG